MWKTSQQNWKTSGTDINTKLNNGFEKQTRFQQKYHGNERLEATLRY